MQSQKTTEHNSNTHSRMSLAMKSQAGSTQTNMHATANSQQVSGTGSPGGHLPRPSARSLNAHFSHHHSAQAQQSQYAHHQNQQRKHNSTDEQKNKRFKHLIDLAPSNIFDFQFFTAQQDADKIDVNFDQVNSMLQIIENQRKKSPQAPQPEKSESYDPKVVQKITLQNLKNRIQLINPSYPVQDITSLLPGKGEITAKELTEVLKQNEIQDFDPLSEALKFFCDEQTGNFSFNSLQRILGDLGYGELDKKDIEILRECLDVDQDGKISQKDLQEVFNAETFKFINQAYNKREFK